MCKRTLALNDLEVDMPLNPTNRCGVMAKVLDYNLDINEFEFQSGYYVHFPTNTLEKDMNSLSPLLWVKWYRDCSSTMMDLVLNQLQRLICP